MTTAADALEAAVVVVVAAAAARGDGLSFDVYPTLDSIQSNTYHGIEFLIRTLRLWRLSFS